MTRSRNPIQEASISQKKLDIDSQPRSSVHSSRKAAAARRAASTSAIWPRGADREPFLPLALPVPLAEVEVGAAGAVDPEEFATSAVSEVKTLTYEISNQAFPRAVWFGVVTVGC